MAGEVLHCASCGAAIGPEARSCGHCGAPLATVACPTCFGMMYQGAKFCPHCGAVAVQWEGKATGLLCPGCEAPLLRGRLRDFTVHECGQCHGFWVDAVTFEQICRTAETEAVTSGALGAVAPPEALPLTAVRYVRCPQCRELMHRVNFSGQSRVVVDVCRAHGTWFDANELHRIVQFIRSGGLDRARERQKAELAEARRRLEAARRPGSGDAGEGAAGRVDLFPEVIRASGGLLGRWLGR